MNKLDKLEAACDAAYKALLDAEDAFDEAHAEVHCTDFASHYASASDAKRDEAVAHDKYEAAALNWAAARRAYNAELESETAAGKAYIEELPYEDKDKYLPLKPFLKFVPYNE